MGYYCASYSFGSTGEKTLVLDLGGTPIGCRITMGARQNTTETSPVGSTGMSDGTNTYCFASASGVAKRWPYTAESSYVAVGYSAAGVKKVSAKPSTVNPFFGDDELCLNVDLADSNYPMVVEVWN